MKKIKICEVCGNEDLVEVLNLGLHPMCDDLVEVGNERVCKEYPIVILFCNNCRTAHQKYQIPKNELFPKTYHYRSRFTSDVLDGMKLLVNECKKYIPNLIGKKVLDIGCNDGSLLDFFKAEGAITVGIEPTDASVDAKNKGHLTYSDFLTLSSAKVLLSENGFFDVVTFTNVFAHIEDLNNVIESLKVLIKDDTIIIIENHYLGAVLDKNQFDTFYHEHPRTYSYNSFVYIAKSLGLDLLNVEFPSRYGGNIRVIIGNKKKFRITDFLQDQIITKEDQFLAMFDDMRTKIENWKVEKSKHLEELVVLHGPLKAKSFPGRAAILVKLLELDTTKIEATFEKPGSMKIGNYLPGTRIEIKSDTELFKTIRDEKVIINFAWHIDKEIELYLKDHGFRGELVNIL